MVRAEGAAHAAGGGPGWLAGWQLHAEGQHGGLKAPGQSHGADTCMQHWLIMTHHAVMLALALCLAELDIQFMMHGKPEL